MFRTDRSTCPDVSGERPDAILRSVDFPHPEGPTIAKNSPCRSENETSLTASVPSAKVLPADRNESTSPAAAAEDVAPLLSIEASTLIGRFRRCQAVSQPGCQDPPGKRRPLGRTRKGHGEPSVTSQSWRDESAWALPLRTWRWRILPDHVRSGSRRSTCSTPASRQTSSATLGPP